MIGSTRGFTLVETLAATVLAALLLITVMTVIASLGRERRDMARRAVADPTADLVDVIRWDLVNARDVTPTRDGVSIDGFASLDPKSRERAGHRPVRVLYEVRRSTGRSWLVRRQLDSGGADPRSEELVTDGVVRLLVTPWPPRRPGERGVHGPATTRVAAGATSQPSAAPASVAAVRLQVKWDDLNRPALDRILVLR
jgi:hypothetical protein